MQNKVPVVSIVLPTQNRAHSLYKSIDSVINQSFEDWELFVIDNFSTDDTPKLMEKYCKQDLRIQYFSIPKSDSEGITDYLNFGVNKASGKYIGRMDDDDYWYCKDKLKKQVEFLDNNKEYCVVGGGVILIDDKGNHLFKYYKKETDEEIRKFMLFSNPFTHTTVLFRKEVIEKVGGYPPGIIEDWNLWLRMGKEGKMYNFPEYFACYTTAGQNLSFRIQRKQAKRILSLIKGFKKDYPNYKKAYFLNLSQYIYTYLPEFIRKPLQSFMFYLKRTNF